MTRNIFYLLSFISLLLLGIFVQAGRGSSVAAVGETKSGSEDENLTGVCESKIDFVSHSITNSFGALNSKSSYSGDLDGDSDIDILAADGDKGKVAWWENNGHGGFVEHSIDSDYSDPISVSVGDMDADLDFDVVAASIRSYWPLFLPNQITWWENSGSGTLIEKVIEPDYEYNPSVVVAVDVDSNGSVDILGGGESDQDEIAWWKNDGTGDSFTKHIINAEVATGALFPIDLDEDGDLDFLSNISGKGRSSDLSWWENNGHEQFTEIIIEHNYGTFFGLFAVDLDSDKDIDILATAAYEDSVDWWENDGNENFSRQVIDKDYNFGFSVHAADVDSDGDQDVVGAAAHDGLVWWENDGKENFSRQCIDDELNGSWAFASDVDGDTDIDIVSSDPLSIVWWENTNTPEQPPDFRVNFISWYPRQPELMGSTKIEVRMSNEGGVYLGQKDTYDLRLRLSDSETEDEWSWIFEGDLGKLIEPGGALVHTIDPFMFTNRSVDKIEACFLLGEHDADVTNNCSSKEEITVNPPKELTRECLAVVVNALDVIIGATPVDDAYELQKQLGKSYIDLTQKLVLNCSTFNDSCFAEIASFTMDIILYLAEGAVDALTDTIVFVLELIKHFLHTAFISSCGEHLGTAVRYHITEANYRGIVVDEAIVSGPVHIVVKDFEGRRAGYLENGTYVNEISGARIYSQEGNEAVVHPGKNTASVEFSRIKDVNNTDGLQPQGVDASVLDLDVVLSRSNNEVHSITFNSFSTA